MQEDEIQLLKMALADVLKRLNISEEHQAAAGRRAPGAKGEQRSVRGLRSLSTCQFVDVKYIRVYSSFCPVDLYCILETTLISFIGC